jgi:hypothetical protein
MHLSQTALVQERLHLSNSIPQHTSSDVRATRMTQCAPWLTGDWFARSWRRTLREERGGEATRHVLSSTLEFSKSRIPDDLSFFSAWHPPVAALPCVSRLWTLSALARLLGRPGDMSNDHKTPPRSAPGSARLAAFSKGALSCLTCVNLQQLNNQHAPRRQEITPPPPLEDVLWSVWCGCGGHELAAPLTTWVWPREWAVRYVAHSREVGGNRRFHCADKCVCVCVRVCVCVVLDCQCSARQVCGPQWKIMGHACDLALCAGQYHSLANHGCPDSPSCPLLSARHTLSHRSTIPFH